MDLVDKKKRSKFLGAQSIYGYLLGMVVEVLAILALMGIGLLVSSLGFLVWQ